MAAAPRRLLPVGSLVARPLPRLLLLGQQLAETLSFPSGTSAQAAITTTINAAGLRLFDGDFDRFVIFALVV